MSRTKKLYLAFILIGIGGMALGATIEDKLIDRHNKKRKPLLVEAWSILVVRAQEEKLTKTEAQALVRNVLARVKNNFELEECVKVINEELEFLSVVREH